MDIRFLPHNSHLEGSFSFEQTDPNLRQIKKQPLIHQPSLLEKLPRGMPGIYSITGGRQVGKTTLLKQWMAKLLKEGVVPQNIAYLTGEIIDDHHSLVRIITETASEMPQDGIGYILLDEVTYIKEWDKAVKFIADAGMLENKALVITGSDTAIIKEARMRFPGRRGASPTVDFHLHSLSFRESVRLHKRLAEEEINALLAPDQAINADAYERLRGEFDRYLAHGGFLTAMNDLAQHGRVLPATYATYSDWIRGDVLKRNRQEQYLKEILGAIIKHYGSQITWNRLSHNLSIDHPKTVADYIGLLESMDVVFVQPALSEHTLSAAAKKARKVLFKDPFIFHAVRSWLSPSDDPFTKQVVPFLNDPEGASQTAEACAAAHYARLFPTYYIKGTGEVDIAYIEGDRFRPVEVKWTAQLRPHELKQIKKYPNGLILTKTKERGEVIGIRTLPLPIALLRLGE